jgi:APA family basic amino acid/polyamine antiporter
MTVNVITIAKIILIIFMISVGFALFQPSNMIPFTPYGFSGILGGSTAFFFGFIGFDEVCCLAAEAKNPQKVLPQAVFGTIFIVTVLTCFAAVALAGTQPYTDTSTESGFADAFNSRGLNWAGQIVSVGELLTLPLVVLVSFLAQPRIQYALARDGLMPKIFAEVDSKGNLTKGIAITGAVVTLIAIFVPFTYLNDMISAGVLFSFNLSNSAIIIIRRGQYKAEDILENAWHPCTRYLLCFHAVAIVLAFFLVNLISSDGPVATADVVVSTILIVAASAIAITVGCKCPENEDPAKLTQYRTPFMPYLPLFGIVVNYLLIAQLTWLGLLLIVAYFGLATIYYFTYCINSPDSISMRYSKNMRGTLLADDSLSLSTQENAQFIRKETRKSDADDLSQPPDEGESVWRDRLSKDYLLRKE